MLQIGSLIKCADNSGARSLNIFNIPGFSRRRFVSIGDIVVCSVNGTTGIGTAVADHEVVSAVIVRCRKEIRRKDGSYIRFDDNAGVIIDKAKVPRATRVFGPVARELRELGYNKIVSLAPEVW
ncbi:50S ribosomal protein L14 [candidate division WWE3 bacterium RIFCSPLOWO2_01_FULL_39_13]|uniref:Large ribosomal subunit protein uL14 n=1 Tax=candidate division WWE3 bacterium RIFCSPLOWO2_01_FULL_39_13 TaxID=1802624 RepID=A0A1F4V4P4_UNCKA|nr:MAG: 50S ribosomal protein L14 [candidate division WWE3 bacterium RIFCSPLOWO2_01_FULL_39_13]